MKKMSLNEPITVSFLSESGERRYMEYCKKAFGKNASKGYNRFMEERTKELWSILNVFRDAITGPSSREIRIEELPFSTRVHATLTKTGKENIKNYFYYHNTLDIAYQDVVKKGEISLELWQMVQIFAHTFKRGNRANFTDNSIYIPETIKEEQA